MVARTVPSDPSDLDDGSGGQLMAVPVTGGAPITLLRHANSSVVPAPGGSLLVVGGTPASRWS